MIRRPKLSDDSVPVFGMALWLAVVAWCVVGCASGGSKWRSPDSYYEINILPQTNAVSLTINIETLMELEGGNVSPNLRLK